MHQRLLLGGFLAAAIALAEPPESAETQDAPAAAPAAPAPFKIGGITVSGGFRTREEDWQWFESNLARSKYIYSSNLLRLAFSQSFESFDWQLEFSLPFLLALPNNAIAAGTPGQLGLGAAYFVGNSKSQDASMIF